MLWMYDKRAGKAVQTRAFNIASQIRLYDVHGWPFGPDQTADDSWGYEGRLPTALDVLESGAPLSGQMWLEVVVPFVAGLLMRAPDFADHFYERVNQTLLKWARAKGMDEKTNAETARFLDFQFLLAPLMAMDWTVLHLSDRVALITSDRALSGAVTPIDLGIAIPLGLRTILVLSRSMRRAVLRRNGDSWIAPIGHYGTVDEEAVESRRAIARFARSAIFGSTREDVEGVAAEIGTQIDAHRLPIGGTEPVDWGCHMYDYFRVLSAAVASRPTQAEADTINWAAVESWRAPVVADLLFPERARGGVAVGPNEISIDLGFGALVRDARRTRGDFRQGMYVLLPLDHLRRLAPPFPRVDPQREASMDAALRLHARGQVMIAITGHLLLLTMQSPPSTLH